MTSVLEACERELSAGRRRAAYDAALEAWHASHAPDIADLLVAMAGAFGDAAPVGGRTLRALGDGWSERAKACAPADRRGLFAQLARLMTPQTASIAGLCLDLWDGVADPTLVEHALRFAALRGGNTEEGPWGELLGRLLSLIGNAADPRAIPALDALAVPSPDRNPATTRYLSSCVPRPINALRRLEVRPLTSAEQQIVERCAALVARPIAAATEASPGVLDVDRLYAAVLADPDDVAAIAVWGDALQQRGDSRGELVALQLAGPQAPEAAAAARALIDRDWRMWLEPISRGIDSAPEFERGLFAACTSQLTIKAVAERIYADPAWATVRRLTFRGHGALGASMQWLEEARGVSEQGLAVLATATLPRLRMLEVETNLGTHDDGLRRGVPVGRGLTALSTTRGLPALRSLAIATTATELDGGQRRTRTAADFRWLTDAPVLATLEELSLNVAWNPWPRDGLAAWREILAPATKLRRLVLVAESRLVVRWQDRTLEVGPGIFRALDGQLPSADVAAARMLAEGARLLLAIS